MRASAIRNSNASREDLILGSGQSQLQVPPAKPFRHRAPARVREAHGRRARARGSIPAPRLNLGEREQRVPVEPIRIVARIETLQILSNAQIFEEQKTPGDVCLVHMRHMRAQGFQKPVTFR